MHREGNPVDLPNAKDAPADQETTSQPERSDHSGDPFETEAAFLDVLSDLELRVFRSRRVRDQLWQDWLTERVSGTPHRHAIDDIRAGELPFPRSRLDRERIRRTLGFVPAHPGEFDDVQASLESLESRYATAMDQYRAFLSDAITDIAAGDVSVSTTRTTADPERASVQVTVTIRDYTIDLVLLLRPTETTTDLFGTMVLSECDVDRETLKGLAALEHRDVNRDVDSLARLIRRTVLENEVLRNELDIEPRRSEAASLEQVLRRIPDYLDRIEYSWLIGDEAVLATIQTLRTVVEWSYEDRVAHHRGNRALDVGSIPL